MYWTGLVTGNNFVINFCVNSNSDHVIYLLSCARCEMQYVGSTIIKFRTRFNANRILTIDNRAKDDSIYRHFIDFNQPDHWLMLEYGL